MRKHSTCYHLLALFPLLSLITGCGIMGSSTNYMASFPDPAFIGIRYTSVAVHFDNPNLFYRKAVESKLVEELRERKNSAVESSMIIPPTRSWDSASIYGALAAAGIEGYIRIVETDSWIVHTYVPEKQETKVKREGTEKKVPQKKRRGEEKQDSVIRTVETETVTTTTTGGYTRETTWHAFRIELVDVATGKIAWLGTKNIEGSVSYKAQDFGEKIAGQLHVDGLMR